MTTTTAERSRSGHRGPAQKTWWRRPWVAPLAVITVGFVAFSVPPYTTFDPGRSRVPVPEGVGPYYPALVLHVFFGAIAILTCCLQVWPWLRRNHPAVHRVSGRIYVFAGAVPAGLCALVIGVTTPFGPIAMVNNVMLATMWLICTVRGYQMARRRRFGDHRRWMIRSFALTTSILVTRLSGGVYALFLIPQLETTYEGNQQLWSYSLAGLSTGMWVVNLLIAEWWLTERGAGRRRPRPASTGAPRTTRTPGRIAVTRDIGG